MDEADAEFQRKINGDFTVVKESEVTGRVRVRASVCLKSTATLPAESEVRPVTGACVCQWGLTQSLPCRPQHQFPPTCPTKLLPSLPYSFLLLGTVSVGGFYLPNSPYRSLLLGAVCVSDYCQVSLLGVRSLLILCWLMFCLHAPCRASRLNGWLEPMYAPPHSAPRPV